MDYNIIELKERAEESKFKKKMYNCNSWSKQFEAIEEYMQENMDYSVLDSTDTRLQRLREAW